MRTRVGHVTHYYNRIGVATLYLIDDLKLGDTLLILGHTTDFVQPVYSIEVNHQKITSACPGMQIALKVMSPVRDGDLVYRLLVDQEAPENAEIWNLALGVQEQLARLYDPVFDKFMSETGLDVGGAALLLAAVTFEPQSTNAARLRVRSPYTSIKAYRDRLRQVAGSGYLEAVGPDDYRLTPLGYGEVYGLIDECRRIMSQAVQIPKDNALRLVELFERLVGSSLESIPPPVPWSIRYSSNLMPESDPALPYIEQAISCLAAYRDDAHLAAWRLSGLTAIALESITILWREEITSLEGLTERLHHRGHDVDHYRDALVELCERGFITGDDSAVSLTEDGLAFRLRVECDTDRYFYHPWSCLSAADRIDMACCLTQLQEQLVAN